MITTPLQQETTQDVPLLKQWDESKNVSSTSYSKNDQLLTIEFKNGSQYQYREFPMEQWIELLNAPSIGTFISQAIKGHYGFIRINK